MHFDALAAACMAAELRRLLCPGHIQGVLLPDANSLGLEVYAHSARRQLLLCAAPTGARVHLVDHKLRRGVEGETPLLLLVRKYLRDALLADVVQPDPTERVLYLHCQHKEHGPTVFVVELIGRQANLLLLRPDGRILDCLHRHTGTATRSPGEPRERLRGLEAGQPGDQPGGRVLLPGRAYVPPPLQDKLPPRDDGRPDYYERLAGVLNTPGRLAKVLVGAVAGLSPTAAREIAWRAAGDAETLATATNVLAVAAALQSLWAPAAESGTEDAPAWQPGNLLEGTRIAGFAPYALHGPGAFVPTPTFSAAVAAYYTNLQEQGSQATADPYAQQRANVAAALRRARQGIERRLGGLAADEPAPGAAQRLRAEAAWLLALSSQVQPGQEVLEIDLDEGPLRIALDRSTTPIDQAQRLFRRAAKYARAEQFIPQRRAELQEDLALVEQLTLDLQRATNQPEMAAVVAELQSAGLAGAPGRGGKQGKQGQAKQGQAKQGQAKQGQGGLLRVRSAQGLEIVIGRNARQNERVTFAEAHPEDLWLHARGVPGSHTIIRGAGQVPNEETIRTAAQLAAYHSGARGERAVDVLVTRKRWIQRAPGGKVGQVLVKQEERVVTVSGELPGQLSAES